MYRARENAPCLDVSHEKLVVELSNATATATSSYRPWFYQTCTEFGFCENLFLIPSLELYPGPRSLALTGKYFGVCCLGHVFLTKETDPWMELSVVWNDTMVDNDRVILIDGTAHCMDMNADKSMDKPALHQARKVKI
uniref:Uncharacterized protein n=1 Tax=Sinocyclocheilus grahami TaxID=75366 RepID=A0A672L0W5_SINGR